MDRYLITHVSFGLVALVEADEMRVTELIFIWNTSVLVLMDIDLSLGSQLPTDKDKLKIWKQV